MREAVYENIELVEVEPSASRMFGIKNDNIGVLKISINAHNVLPFPENGDTIVVEFREWRVKDMCGAKAFLKEVRRG